MPAMCRGMRVLRGRLALRCIPELADANGDTYPRVLHHRLPASRRSFHMEIWACEGRSHGSLGSFQSYRWHRFGK